MATERTVKLIARLQDNMSGGLKNLRTGTLAVAGAMAAVITAVAAAAKKLADYGAKIYDVAKANNLALDTTQALGYVADQTGSSIEGLGGSIRALNSFMTSAQNESSAQAQALRDLGLEYNALRAMSPEDVFLTLSDALGQVDDDMTQNMLAATVFGNRYGTQVVGALNQTDGSLRNLMDSFRESGRMLTDEQVTALKKYDDAMTDVDYAMKSLMADAIVPILPELQGLTDRLVEIATRNMPAMENAAISLGSVLIGLAELIGLVATGWEKIGGAVDWAAGHITGATRLNAQAEAQSEAALQSMQALQMQMLRTGQTSGPAWETVASMLSLVSEKAEEAADAIAVGDGNTRRATRSAIEQREVLDEIVKRALGLKDILANVKDKYSESKEDAKELLAIQREAAEAEERRLQMIAQGTANLFTGIAMAATQGQDALDAWFDRFKQRLLELVISSAFKALLGVLSPGGFFGNIFSGIVGRVGGGPVPMASGGRVVPGSPGMQGDKVPMMLEPGELVLSRNQRRDMERAAGGGSGVVINIEYKPVLSTASRAEVARLGVEVRDALRKVGAL